jgi:thymidylate synthase
MNNLDKQYRTLLQTILDYGVVKGDRTGTGTKSIFGYTIRHNMKEGFPLLTTKKMYFKGIVTELIWFLRGDTNIKYLVENNCNIWNGDAYKRYANSDCEVKWLFNKAGKEPCEKDDYYRHYTMEEFINKIKTDDEFAKAWGELGPIYGRQWRNWVNINYDNLIVDYSGDNTGYTLNEPIDQIANLINELKTNPDSRRLMVNAWNIGELDQMVLPPCHYGFQVYTRELSESERFKWYGNKIGSHMHHDHIIHEMNQENVPTRAISLMWNQRSVDTPLGLPFNIASYGLLLEIIAKIVNMVPDELIGNLGDTHIYLNQVEGCKEQIGRDMTFEDKLQWVMRHTDVELENLAITERAHGEDVPTTTRAPFPLPKLVHAKTDSFYRSLSENLDLFSHLDPSDFGLEGYVCHPKIDFPLSN